MNEETIIRQLRCGLRKPREQQNEPFTSDAEIVELFGSTCALTLDEFSAEDGLTAAVPGLLGWNLVVATLSDLLAVGAEPRYMMNALVVEPAMDRYWVSAFAEGAQCALQASGAAMLGGDVGSADSWRFTGLGIGAFPNGRPPVGRLSELEQGMVLATGTYGDGNLAVVTGDVPRFESRLLESRRLARTGAAAIDTSDGFGPSLESICRLDGNLRIEIELDAVPIANGVEEAAEIAGIPPGAFLLGSAGEYELLSLAPDAAVPEGGTIRRIGSFWRSGEAGIFYRLRSGRLVRQPLLPDPREISDLAAYREIVVDLARSVFEPGGRP